MKPSFRLSFLFSAFLSISGAGWLQAEDLTADWLTVNAGATISGLLQFGTASTGVVGASPSTTSAFQLSIAQGLKEITVPYTVEGHYEEGYVTVEDYGWVPDGYTQPQYTITQIGSDYFPAVYDNEGNIVTEAYTEPRYESIYTGDMWIETGTRWAVIGSHTEMGQIWVDSYESSYTDYLFEAPKIQFTASRSDANWAWQVPTENSGEYKDVMVVWNGGLRIPSNDPNRMMALASDSLTQSYDEVVGTERRVHVSRLGSHDLKTTVTTSTGSGAALISAESTNEVKPESIILTRVESQGADPIAVTLSAQTQIAAQSAHFGGVMTVVGDVKVQGVLRLEPAGDLTMGDYQVGPRPVPPAQ